LGFHQCHHPIRSEKGVALVVALMSMLLLTALGLGLAMTTMTETMITANYRDAGEAMYAADAGIERVMQDLLTIPDWNRILTGTAQSSFIDGPPTGTRTLPDGGTIDLAGATNMLNCGKTTTCSVAEMNAWTPERAYTTNNPRWQLFAYSRLADIIETGTVLSSMYVAVWIADDQAETDDDPTTDGGEAGGRGVLLLRAEAFGPNGASSVIEATVARTDTSELERGYSGQRGQDEQNRRARKRAVETPGKSLTRSDLDVSGSSGGFVVR
jgi:Tfp pilus assembly protein PilX